MRPGPFRLKADFEPRAGCLGVLFKCPSRRHAPAAFESRDHGLRGIHTLRHLLLRQARAGAGFDPRGGKRKPLFQCFIFAPVLRVRHPFFVEIISSGAF